MPLWTEWGTALLAEAPGFKFACYGTPDPKSMRTQIAERRRTGALSWPRWLAERIAGRVVERLHIAAMRRYELHGNVAANDAAYYAQQGVPNAFYVQNAWIDRLVDSWRGRRSARRQAGPCVIIGNVGKLGGTANTLGLEYLGRELMSHLRERMAAVGRAFEVRILGAGSLRPDLVPLFQAPGFRMRGFVPDIDQEILDADIFLGVNNASHYKVAHTRYLHAWSLGACLVVHADTALSIPEVVHRKNALMRRSAAEIAGLVAEAAVNPEQRAQLGEAGYSTYREVFTGPAVARAIAERLYRAGIGPLTTVAEPVATSVGG